MLLGQTNWTMTSPSRDSQVLVIPRREGLLIVVDGVPYWKAMRPIQLVWFAQSLLAAASEAMEREDGLVRKGPEEDQGGGQTKIH